MRSVTVARRLSAIVALAAVVGVLAIMVVVLAKHLLPLLVGALCLGVAVSAAAYALTRTGARLVAAVVAVLALLAPIVLVVAYGQLLQLVLLLALAAVAGAATRHALGRDIHSLKSGPTPGVVVGPAVRPVLLMNPRSGGGKVERFRLVEEARRRGIEPIVLQPGDDLLRLAGEAVARGADVLGMAGGDGSQALVAGVAMRYDVAFVCVPAGTRNHLAMDLGLDRGDVVGALDAFGEAVERRIDLGLIGDRVFVNNATVGLYAKIVQSPEYRDRKVGTALELLPAMLGPQAVPFDLRFTGPDGTEHESAHLILVSNDRYELDRGEGFGSRRRIDAGTLGIVAARFRSAGDVARFVQLQTAGRARRFPGWAEWDRHQLRGAIPPAGGDRDRRGGDAAGPTDPVPDRPGGTAGADPTTRARLLSGRRRAHPRLVHHHRPAADGRRPTGDHPAVTGARPSALVWPDAPTADVADQQGDHRDEVELGGGQVAYPTVTTTRPSGPSPTSAVSSSNSRISRSSSP